MPPRTSCPRSERVSTPFCSTASRARARRRSISKPIAECLEAGEAGARPASRDRAYRAVPEALRGAFRLRAGRVAFRPSLVPAPPRLARHRERRSGSHRRRPIGPVPALSKPWPHRRRRSPRAELQAGGRRPVPCPRHGGDARQVRRNSGHPLLGDAGDREPAHGRARPLSRSQPSRTVRRRLLARNPADRFDPGPAATRPLACASNSSASSKPISSAANNPCSSSIAAVSRR